MATKREWLAERGLAKPGARGKFSKEAHEALDAAVASGVVFDEPVVVAKPRTASASVPTPGEVFPNGTDATPKAPSGW